MIFKLISLPRHCGLTTLLPASRNARLDIMLIYQQIFVEDYLREAIFSLYVWRGNTFFPFGSFLSMSGPSLLYDKNS